MDSYICQDVEQDANDNFYKIRWTASLSPVDWSRNLDHIFLAGFFDASMWITKALALQKCLYLHQCYRVCFSVLFISITIPLICISFLYSIVKVISISCHQIFKLIIQCLSSQLSQQSKHFVVRLIYSVIIVLVTPLIILCLIGNEIIMHLRHFIRFHQYVGSLDKQNGVIFNDDGDDDDDMCMILANYLLKKIQSKFIGALSD